MKSKLHFILYFAMVLMALESFVSFAGTTWDDGGSTWNWSEAANWNKPNGIPASGADVSFGSGGTYVTTDINPTVGLVTLNRNGNFAINGPGIITINTGFTTERNNRVYTIGSPIVFGNNNTWTNLNARTTLTVNSNVDTANYDLTINNTGIINLNSSVSSYGDLIKSGTGILNINTNNEKFGSLTLNSGTLGLDFKTITLDSNATFNGGTLRLSVGNSTTYGQIIAGNTMSGNISLGNGTTLLSLSFTGYVAQDFDKIWLLNNNSNGSTSGYFTGLTQGSSIVIGGITMYMFYNADYGTGSLFGGNDILLAVPEPSSALTLLLGCSFVLLVRPQRSTKE
jgi:hypothetical protein